MKFIMCVTCIVCIRAHIAVSGVSGILFFSAIFMLMFETTQASSINHKQLRGKNEGKSGKRNKR